MGTDASLMWTLGVVLETGDTLPFPGLKALSLAGTTKAPFGAWAWIQTHLISNPVSTTFLA